MLFIIMAMLPIFSCTYSYSYDQRLIEKFLNATDEDMAFLDSLLQ
jgi:hypothetical protein